MNQPLLQLSYIDTCDADFTGAWQPGAIFRAMQRAGDVHSRALGFGYEELRSHSLAWVLTCARLRMDEYPLYGQEVAVRTWPGAARHGLYPRYYTFEKEGRMLGSACALYVLLDLNTRKIALPGRFPREMPLFDEKAPLPLPGRPRLTEEEAILTAYRPVYTDLDTNGHVNNTRYIDWYMNQYPCEFHAANRLREIQAHYFQELRPDDNVTFARQGRLLRVLCDDTLHCALEGAWEKRL